jgi:hypothetical protein
MGLFFNPTPVGGKSGKGTDILGDIAAGGINAWVRTLPKEISDAMSKGFLDARNSFDGIFSDAFSNLLFNKYYQYAIDTFKKLGEVVSKSWEKADQAAYSYGKRLGMTSAQVQNVRDSIIKLNETSGQFGIKYGQTLEEIIKLQSDFSAQVGRAVRLTNEQLKDMAALKAVVGEDVAVKFAAQLESFGLSTTSAGELIGKMYSDSAKKGISIETYSKNVNENLHLAQQYTFKKGVDGLVAMAQNAAKLKMDMQQVVALANKVSDVESAVNMSAELQVLGGAFSQFADPLGLLHDSLLDMEGLSDRLTNLIGEIGYFNKETGQIDIGSFDRIRLRSAAQSMGLDYGKLIESAAHQAKRQEIETQMVGMTHISDEYKELIMNTAQFQNGIAGIRGADGTFKSLASLNGEDLAMLADYAKTDSENIRDIAQMMRGMTDIREGTEKEKENQRASMYQQQSAHIKGIYEDLGESKDALQKLVKLELGRTVNESFGAPLKQLGGKATDLLTKLILKKAGITKTNAEGGLITNGTPGREYVLNSAQNGEFIVNKESTIQHFGLLSAINSDKHGKLRIKQNANGTDTIEGKSSNETVLSLIKDMLFDVMTDKSDSKSLADVLFNPEKLLKTRLPVQKNYTPIIKMKTGQFNNLAMKLSEAENAYRKNPSQVNLETLNKLTKESYKAEEQLQKLQSLANEQRDMLTEMQTKNYKTAKLIKGTVKVGSGIISGAAALTSSIQQYKADGTNVMNHGKAVGGTIGATAGAAIGSMLGVAAGPIGIAIGGAIGEFAGKKIGETIGSGSSERRQHVRAKINKEMSSTEGANKFMMINGDFSVNEMRRISKALEDGKLREMELKDDKLVQKLKAYGNEDIFTKKFANGGILRGNSHANGGIVVNEAEGGEFIVNKKATSMSLSTLNKINEGKLNDSNIKPIEPMGKQMKVKENGSNSRTEQIVKMEPINININGTIKLDSGDKTIDISKELFNNPTLINKLTDIITKQLNIDDNFGFNMKTYRRKYSSI